MIATPNIVLIDDDVDWTETLADYLRGKGFRVEIANAASAGLDFLAKHEIPLALVDWNMPEMTGIELVHRLRALNRQVSVFLVSGDDEPSLPSRALKAGANAFLPKSTPPNVLLRTLRQALERSRRTTGLEKRYLPVVGRTGRMLPAVPPGSAP